MLSVRAFKGISKSPFIILLRLTAQFRKRNCHSVFRNLIDDMSNNTTCFPLNNISSPCGSTNESKNRIPYAHAAILPSTIIIAILWPIAVAGNSLVLAAIWKRSFQRSPFHVLLSGMVVTDLCTGLIAQPFIVATNLLYLTKPTFVIKQPGLFLAIKTTGDASATYSIAFNLLIITLMSVERWLHMSRRSLVISRRGRFTAVTCFLLPIPEVVFRSMETLKPGTGQRLLNMTIVVSMFVCFLITFVSYVNVFRLILRHQQQIQVTENFGQPAINLAKYKKSVFTILIILAFYCICFLPIIFSLSIHFQVGDSSKMALATSVSFVFLFLSPSLSPILYLCRMNDVRAGVKILLSSGRG